MNRRYHEYTNSIFNVRKNELMFPKNEGNTILRNVEFLP